MPCFNSFLFINLLSLYKPSYYLFIFPYKNIYSNFHLSFVITCCFQLYWISQIYTFIIIKTTINLFSLVSFLYFILCIKYKFPFMSFHLHSHITVTVLSHINEHLSTFKCNWFPTLNLAALNKKVTCINVITNLYYTQVYYFH